MNESVLLWLLGIIVTVVIGLAIGLFVHVKEDTKAHERLATLEERSTQHGTEIRSLRDMRHEIMEHVSQALASWYQRIVEMIRK